MTYTWLFSCMLSIALNQPSLVLGWPFYNFKNSIFNESSSPFKRRSFLTTFWALIRALYLANAMARPLAYHSPCQNSPSIGKDEFAGLASTEGSDTYILALAMSRAPTPALLSAPPLAPILAINLMVRY